MFTSNLSRIFSCFPAKPSSSSSPEPPPVKDLVKAFKIIATHSTFLADSCDEFIRTPKGSKAAVRAGNKLDLILRHMDDPMDDPNITKAPLFNALSQAIIHNRPWMFKKLLSHPKININHHPEAGEPPLHHAIRKGNYPVFQELMKRNAAVSPEAACLTAYYGEPEMLDAILAKMPDEEKSSLPFPDIQDYASRQKNKIETMRQTPNIMESLPTSLGNEVRMEEFFPSIAIADRLGLIGNNSDTKGWHPLNVANKFRGARAVMLTRFILNAGADPNSRDYEGNTPIQTAAYRGNAPLLTLLLKAGAHPDLANQHGVTPLHRAAYDRHEENTKALLEAGANPRTMDSNERTPMDHFGLHGYAADKTVLNMLEEAVRQAEHRLPVDIPSSSSAAASSWLSRIKLK